MKREFLSDFRENLTEFYQISLKILVNLTDISPQDIIMACIIHLHIYDILYSVTFDLF